MQNELHRKSTIRVVFIPISLTCKKEFDLATSLLYSLARSENTS